MYIIVMYGMEIARKKRKTDAMEIYWEYANIHGEQEVEIYELRNGVAYRVY